MAKTGANSRRQWYWFTIRQKDGAVEAKNLGNVVKIPIRSEISPFLCFSIMRFVFCFSNGHPGFWRLWYFTFYEWTGGEFTTWESRVRPIKWSPEPSSTFYHFPKGLCLFILNENEEKGRWSALLYRFKFPEDIFPVQIFLTVTEGRCSISSETKSQKEGRVDERGVCPLVSYIYD